VVVWQERASMTEPSNIRAQVWGDTVTLVSTDSNSYHPHAVAEMASPGPSIQQIRVALLWVEEVIEDGDTFGELRFKVDSLNVSKAGPCATAPNNGCKLLRKRDDDSLFAVYRDAGWSLMYAWSEDGTEWQREPLFGRTAIIDPVGGLGAAAMAMLQDPALAEDSSGRRWVICVKPAMPEFEDSLNQVLGSYRCDDTWSTPQVLYEVRFDSGWVFCPSLAGASDAASPCAYAGFVVGMMDSARLVVAKFDGTNIVTSTVPTPTTLPEPPCVATEPVEGGDNVHLSWPGEGEVYYTMTQAPVPADSWTPSPMSWDTAINLSGTASWSWMPVVGVGQSKVVAAWTEEGDWEQGEMPDIMARFRSRDSAYDNWEDPVDLSQSPTRFSDSPVLSFTGDSVAVVWQEGPAWFQDTASHERTLQDADYQDIMASIDFQAPMLLVSRPLACFPHAQLENEASGDSFLGYVHTVWSDQPKENYFEVGYRKCSLSELGGGGGPQSAGSLMLPVLYGCRPNPFARGTAIPYQIPVTAQVLLRVYDVSGRVVRTLVNGPQKPGRYTVQWDCQDDQGRKVSSGIYFYRLETPGFRDTRKAVVVR